MAKVKSKLYTLADLDEVNAKLTPLIDLVDREMVSIRGLTGMVYTPYLDEYMQLAIEKSNIIASLKEQNILPISQVEIIHTELNALHSRARTRAVVEYQGNHYERRFLPLKLSKSGKNVRKWAKVWLLHDNNGNIEPNWEKQVRELWPTYYLIRTIEM